VWDEQEHLVSRRVMSRRTRPFQLDDVASHAELIEWMMGEHEKFKKFILPRVYQFADGDNEE
jgi:hypothetical protein